MRHPSFSHVNKGYYRARGASDSTGAEIRVDFEYPTILCGEDQLQIMMIESSGYGGSEYPFETAICMPLDIATELLCRG